MGYDLHITRAKYWFENDGHEITPEEWLALVRDDPELALAEEYGPYFAMWRGPSRYPDPWFDLVNGSVMTKNPDEPMIEKMVQIAERLGAKVQGDDCEVYPGGGQPAYYEDLDEDMAPSRSQAGSIPWWKRWFRR
jgi:hypothetical protein